MQNPKIVWQGPELQHDDRHYMTETPMGGLLRLLSELSETTLFQPYHG